MSTDDVSAFSRTKSRPAEEKSEEKLKLGIVDILSDHFREIVIDKARYEKTVRLCLREARYPDFVGKG